MANHCCPICGGENRCMMDETKGKSSPCWCTTEKFPKEIFEAIPVESLYKHCICRDCLTKFA